MSAMFQDLRYAIRSQCKNPYTFAGAMLSLSLGIGANSALFGVVDGLLFRPPAHVEHPKTLSRVYLSFAAPQAAAPTPQATFPLYEALQSQSSTFSAIGAYYPQSVALGQGQGAQEAVAVLATASFFEALGSKPFAGRFFTKDEERTEGTLPVILSYELWQSRFGGQASALGAMMLVGSRLYTVIGIARPHFAGLDFNRVDLWLPIGAAKMLVAQDALTSPMRYWAHIVGRLRSNASVQAAEGEATTIANRLFSQGPIPLRAKVILAPVSIARGPDLPVATKLSLWLGVLSTIVLAIACANVINLQLLRALARTRELAIRSSLGAGRTRLVGQLLFESLLVGLGACTLALIFAIASGDAIRTVLTPDTAPPDSVAFVRLFGYTALVALLSSAICGIIPAILTTRPDLTRVLKSGSPASIGTHIGLRRVVIATQIGLTTVLLLAAGLFIRSLDRVRAIPLGLDVDRVVYAHVDLQPGITRRDALAIYQAMLARVRAVPGVTAASFALGAPLRTAWAVAVRLEPEVGRGRPNPVAIAHAVGNDFFESMGIPARRGRLLSSEDQVSRARVAVVSESAAELWPRSDPVGACVWLGDDSECTRIVGVVANTPQFSIFTERQPELYIAFAPYADFVSPRTANLQIRTDGKPAPRLAVLRQVLQSTRGDLPPVSVRPVSEILAPQLRPWRLGASLLSLFGLLSAFLAAVGLYAILAFNLRLKQNEIGIRSALGASPWRVSFAIVRDAVLTSSIGVASGSLLALMLGRKIEALLYGVSPRDPLTFALVAAIVMGSAIAASLMPARRAGRVDPILALRAE